MLAVDFNYYKNVYLKGDKQKILNNNDFIFYVEMAQKIFSLDVNDCSENLKKCICEISELLHERECTPYDIEEEIKKIVKIRLAGEYEEMPIWACWANAVYPIDEDGMENYQGKNIFFFQKIIRQ